MSWHQCRGWGDVAADLLSVGSQRGWSARDAWPSQKSFSGPVSCTCGFCGLYSPAAALCLLVTGSGACPAAVRPHERPSLTCSISFVTVHSHQLPPGPAASDTLQLSVPGVEHLSGVPHRSIILHLHPLLHGVQAHLDARVSQAGQEWGRQPCGPCTGWGRAGTPTWVSTRPGPGSWADG